MVPTRSTRTHAAGANATHCSPQPAARAPRLTPCIPTPCSLPAPRYNIVFQNAKGTTGAAVYGEAKMSFTDCSFIDGEVGGWVGGSVENCYKRNGSSLR